MAHTLDGNAAAGALAEVFSAEMTVAVTTCDHCGRSGPLGELHAYVKAPGVILRCSGCDEVQIRLVRGGGRIWLDFRGTRVIQLQE